MIQQKLLKAFLLTILTAFLWNMMMCMAGCKSIKHLTKTIDQSFARKDSTGKNDSVVVQKDNSRFNSEIVIEYPDIYHIGEDVNCPDPGFHGRVHTTDSVFIKKLLQGADINWDPFYPPQQFDSIIDNCICIPYQPAGHLYVKGYDHSPPVKKITIRTNIQLAKIDSSVYHTTAKLKTAENDNKVTKQEVVKSYPWYYYGIIALVILVILFFLYKKLKSKIKFLA